MVWSWTENCPEWERVWWLETVVRREPRLDKDQRRDGKHTENIRGDVTTLTGSGDGRFAMLSLRDERDILSHRFICYLSILVSSHNHTHGHPLPLPRPRRLSLRLPGRDRPCKAAQGRPVESCLCQTRPGASSPAPV